MLVLFVGGYFVLGFVLFVVVFWGGVVFVFWGFFDEEGPRRGLCNLFCYLSVIFLPLNLTNYFSGRVCNPCDSVLFSCNF